MVTGSLGSVKALPLSSAPMAHMPGIFVLSSPSSASSIKPSGASTISVHFCRSGAGGGAGGAAAVFCSATGSGAGGGGGGGGGGAATGAGASGGGGLPQP